MFVAVEVSVKLSGLPPGALRDRLLAFAADTGTPVNAVVTEAVDEFLARQGLRLPTKGRGITTTRPRRSAAPVAAELARERARDQRDDECDHPLAARDLKNKTRCRCGAVNLPVPLKKEDTK